MTKRIFNKLVRDKIPEIIESRGEICVTKILEKDDYLCELNMKLQEEVAEYLESGKLEELADIEEVLRAIVDIKGVKYEAFERLRLDKVAKRGAFKERIFLESTKDNSSEDN